MGNLTTSIQPMLVKSVTFDQFTSNVLVQPKLDGVRAIWDASNKALFTKNGRQITSCDHIVEALVALNINDHLDGEIYCSTLPFQTINGLCNRRIATDACADLQFHVFDVINDETTVSRLKQVAELEMRFYPCGTKALQTVPVHFSPSSDIESWYNNFIRQGYEGIIIRDPMSLYLSGVGKIKPVEDMEGTLIRFIPSTSRHSSTFGSMLLQLDNGRQVKCSGLSDKDREALWESQPIGEQITFYYEGTFLDGTPRFPRFKSVRYDAKAQGAV